MKAIPAWVCFSMDKDGAIIATLFTSTLPFITGNHASVDSELQIAAAYLIGQLINCLRQSSSLQPLLVDPTFNHLPVEVSRYFFIYRLLIMVERIVMHVYRIYRLEIALPALGLSLLESA